MPHKVLRENFAVPGKSMQVLIRGDRGTQVTASQIVFGNDEIDDLFVVGAQLGILAQVRFHSRGLACSYSQLQIDVNQLEEQRLTKGLFRAQIISDGRRCPSPPRLLKGHDLGLALRPRRIRERLGVLNGKKPGSTHPLIPKATTEEMTKLLRGLSPLDARTAGGNKCYAESQTKPPRTPRSPRSS